MAKTKFFNLEKKQKKELIYFGLSFLFFTLGVYSYMNIQPCYGIFCFDIRPLLAIIWPILGLVLFIKYILLIKKRLKQKEKLKNRSYIIILAGIIILFFVLSHIITFSNVNEREYPNKFKAYKFLVSKLHICPLSKYYPTDFLYDDNAAHCYTWWAKKVRIAAICKLDEWGSLLGSSISEFCYKEVAIVKRNPKICKKVMDQFRYKRCIQPYIEATNDSNACEVLRDGKSYSELEKPYKDQYSGCILSYTDFDYDTCRGFNRTNDDCCNMLANRKSGLTHCYDIEDEESKIKCIFYNLDINNIEACHSSEFLKDLCIYKSIITNNESNYIDCLAIDDVEYRNSCLFYAAYGETNISICNFIETKYPKMNKDDCIGRIQLCQNCEAGDREAGYSFLKTLYERKEITLFLNYTSDRELDTNNHTFRNKHNCYISQGKFTCYVAINQTNPTRYKEKAVRFYSRNNFTEEDIAYCFNGHYKKIDRSYDENLQLYVYEVEYGHVPPEDKMDPETYAEWQWDCRRTPYVRWEYVEASE